MKYTSQELDRALTKAKVGLMTRPDSSFFASVLFNLNFSFNKDIPTACVYDTNIEVNPDFFMSLNQNERIFLLIHESMHIAYLDLLRKGKRDAHIWNMAADYVINLELVNCGFVMPKDGLLNTDYTGMSKEQVYELLLKDQTSKPKLSVNDLVDGLKKASSTSNTQEATTLQQQVEAILVRAATQSRMANDKPGSIPGNLEAMIDKLLHPKLPWYTILKRFMFSATKTDYTYRRPNKRYLPDYILPTLNSEGMGKIVIGIDTSASVSDKEESQFFSELASIIKQLKPKQLEVVLFDTAIRSVHSVKSLSELNKIRFTGRGGTNITPFLKYVIEHKPEIVLVFTDGEFHKPDVVVKSPLIWLIHNNIKFKSKYGKVIHYEIQD